MIEKFQSSLIKWAVKNAGIGSGKVFFAYENVSIPKAPYIMVDIVSGPTEVGTGSFLYNEDNDNFDYKSVLNFTVQFSVYGDNCLEIAMILINSLSKQSVKNDFLEDNVINTSAFNFGIINEGNVENINFLKRNVIELVFRVNQTVENFEDKMTQFNIEPENQLEDKMKKVQVNL